MRILIIALGMAAAAGCGGSGGGGGPTGPVPATMAGTWSGTETIEAQGPACGGIPIGTHTGDIFRVTQTSGSISIGQLNGTCLVCIFTGTVSSNGSFSATGTSTENPPNIRITIVGQVSGDRLTATKTAQFSNIDCDASGHYDLNRN